MNGRHRKPHHLTYFACPLCTTRIVIDLDRLIPVPGSGIYEFFGCDPDIHSMPAPLLAEAEALVEQHEAAHGVAA